MVRFAKDSDFDFVKNSWEVCFDDTEKFVEWNFEHNYNPENTVIAELNGSPASVMQLMPYRLVLGGKELNCRYVSGVATLPEYRGRGLVRSLFEFGISAMRDMDCDISILVPEVDGMYEKFGYAKVCSRTLYTADSLGKASKVEKYDENLIGFLDKIYKSEMQKVGSYINRTKWDWERILTDLLKISGGCVALSDDGYALAYPKNGGYEIGEVFGGVVQGLTPVSAPPVMARVINTNKVLSLFPGDIKEDDSSMAEQLFKKLAPDAYINMLL